MEILFYSICTHLDASVTGDAHRVALPASNGYSVFDPDSGTTLQIPDHTPMLSIRSRDIAAGDVNPMGVSSGVSAPSRGAGLEPVLPVGRKSDCSASMICRGVRVDLLKTWEAPAPKDSWIIFGT